ncbi:CD81 molecule a isoform X1 [Chanodichthys erythropterus]|uniref:CD81 molecule a isoform X1 n=1 Tax=Chanodichthys erythropterus TaxID=933992 RepID=UPI00351DB184
MGVEGCTKCIKYMLFFFNFIFWLAGCVILGVSLWLRHDTKTSSLLELRYQDAEPPSTFYISVYILIAVGAVMMFVGFLGCYGAIQESQCLLGTFFACLVILFACEVAAGIWGFMHKDKISKEMITFYDSVYDKASNKVLQEEQSQAAGAVLKVFHETLQCCGKGGLFGFADKMLSDMCPGDLKINAAVSLPSVKPSRWEILIQIIPKIFFSVFQNCHTKIKDLFREKIYLIGIAALVVAVIMIFEMIFSMVLCCGIRNSPVY